MREMLEDIIMRRERDMYYDPFQTALHYPEFGLAKIIDWDNEARTAIEGINSAPSGGIDRSTHPYWRAK